MQSCSFICLILIFFLIFQVCRVLKAYFISARELVHSSTVVEEDKIAAGLRLKEARQKVEEALGSCLLPSLQLIPANPAVGQEIWEVLCLLPYEVCVKFHSLQSLRSLMLSLQ